MLFCTWMIVAAASAEEPPLVSPHGPKTPAEQQKLFHLPPGFKIELIAAEPAIRKPMNMAFDRRGRLLVTQSTEYPYPAKPGTKPRDTIQIFTDTNEDGVPDKPHAFADGLNIPIGLCPVGDDVVAYSISDIQLFQEVDASGKATKRTPMFTGFGFKDTHGMASSFTRWIDGWIYSCHGYANESKVQRQRVQAMRMHSGNTFRMSPDGRRIEQRTWGQVNPFGMAFDSLGNQFTADCHTKPAYNLLRGAYYPSFEKPHDGLGFGPEMMEHLHGSTGIAGVVVYEADGFPTEYRGHMFIGNPVTGRINRDRLDAKGSTLRAVEQPDFLACEDQWFRPVDVKLAPDGSLYIADFYNCMIGHYEVPLAHPRRDRERGRIWRVSHASVKTNPKASDFASMSVIQLVAELANANLAVRVSATHELVDRGDPKFATMVRSAPTSPSADGRVHAMWALERTGGLKSDDLKRLFADGDRKVRTHVAKLLAERTMLVGDERDWLRSSLKDPDAFVRRAAADALGRHIQYLQVPLILDALEKASRDDTHLVHTLRMCLRDHVKTHPEAFAHKFIPSDRIRIADVALGIPTAASADFVIAYLRDTKDKSRIPEMAAHAVHRSANEKVDEAMEVVARFETDHASWPEQNAAVRAASTGFLRRGKAPAKRLLDWIDRLAAIQLSAGDAKLVQDGLELVRELKVRSAFEKAAALAKPSTRFADLRASALDAAAASNPAESVAVLASVLENAGEPVELRRKASENLGNLAHVAAARVVLAAQLQLASQDLAGVLARGMSRNAEAAKDLAELFDKRKASVLLARDPEVHNNLARAKLPAYERRRARWLKDAPSEDAALANLLDERRKWATAPGANLSAGAVAFTKHCGVCHQVANKGTKVGPQLDGVGVRDVDRLLEDMLAPSRNVDHAFQTTLLRLSDGRTIAGLFLREEGAAVVISDPTGKEQRFEKSSIEERRTSPVSPMPADVGTRLTETEMRDLMAFLRQQRTQPPK